VFSELSVGEDQLRRRASDKGDPWNKLSNNRREPVAVAKRLKAGNLTEDEVETMEVLKMSKDSERLRQPIFVRELDNGEWLVFDLCTTCVSRAFTHVQSGRAIEPVQAYFGTSLW
jgi:hypothetical protein